MFENSGERPKVKVSLNLVAPDFTVERCQKSQTMVLVIGWLTN